MAISPNPITSGEHFTVQYLGAETSQITLKAMDIFGQVLHNWPPGAYTIVVEQANGIQETHKVVILR